MNQFCIDLFDTNTKELNLNDMEMVNGGIFGLICVLGIVAVEIGIAIGVGYATKDSDAGTHGGPLH